jgi:dTDP-3-amino-3,4,6-trideoxy-alpha-D-glucose transaminase
MASSSARALRTGARVGSVPFYDLSPAHRHLRTGILEDIGDLIESGAFTGGSQVEAFETAFAGYCGADACVGVASGLDALRLALIASGLEQGDEVVVPAGTFIATFEAVTHAGGRPVVADIGEADYCLDVEATAAAIGPRTTFVLPVHLYGQMADMASLEKVAARHGLRMLEDACQAHGALRDGRKAGTAAPAGAFSFYPAKNLGAFGDGGALVSRDADLAGRVRALREHGQRVKYRHEFEGYTARLDTIQALVLLHKLPLLDEWNSRRREIAQLYADALEGVGDLRLPSIPSGSEPVWHLFVVQTADPTALASHLAGLGIGSGRHYPEPPHLSAAYSWLGYRPGAFPVAEELSRRCLSLPLFPGMTEVQIGAVVDSIRSYFEGG